MLERLKGKIVEFHDMHSGGGSKEPWGHIFIESDSEEEAKIIFYNIFGHNPERVTCTCCGEDYSISTHRDIAQATGYERGCKWSSEGYLEEGRDERYKPMSYLENIASEYLGKNKEVHNCIEISDGKKGLFSMNYLIIPKDIIKDEWKIGSVPSQGYVWMD